MSKDLGGSKFERWLKMRSFTLFQTYMWGVSEKTAFNLEPFRFFQSMILGSLRKMALNQEPPDFSDHGFRVPGLGCSKFYRWLRLRNSGFWTCMLGASEKNAFTLKLCGFFGVKGFWWFRISQESGIQSGTPRCFLSKDIGGDKFERWSQIEELYLILNIHVGGFWEKQLSIWNLSDLSEHDFGDSLKNDIPRTPQIFRAWTPSFLQIEKYWVLNICSGLLTKTGFILNTSYFHSKGFGGSKFERILKLGRFLVPCMRVSETGMTVSVFRRNTVNHANSRLHYHYGLKIWIRSVQ